MPVLRLFAAAREAAGTGRDVVDGTTVAGVLEAARARYGEPFAAVLRTAKVWVNGEPADGDAVVGEGDEVAVLPPVSGGCGVPPDPRGCEVRRFPPVGGDGSTSAVMVARPPAWGPGYRAGTSSARHRPEVG